MPRAHTTNVGDFGDDKQIDGVALNAAAGSRTLTVNLNEAWAKLILLIDFTRVAATTFDTTVEASNDGTNFFTVQSGAISSGTRTLSDLNDTKDVSGGSATWTQEYDCRGYESMRFVFSGTSAGASDLFDVYVTTVTGD